MRIPSSPRHMQGLSLIELMIALVLGLLVVGAAIGIFMSNRQAYRATESIGRVQEASRVAFEMMSHDIREAGGNPCDKGTPVANVLNGAGAAWWSNWVDGIRGYDDGAAAPFGNAPAPVRVAGTDAIELKSGASGGVNVTAHATGGAQFTVNTVNHGFETGDIAMVCDGRQAAIFQVTSANSGMSNTVEHAEGVGSPGNCTTGLGVPLLCAAGSVKKTFGPNSTMVRMYATAWYVGTNARGGSSLYQVRLNGGAPQAQEITDGVTDMQITYREGGAYVAAGAVANWANVTAARITITLQSLENVGPNGQAVQRQLVHTVSLRNRNA